MSNQDFNPSPPDPTPPPQIPANPISPLAQIARQPMGRVAIAETPGANFTGGRQDAQARDVHTDLPIPERVQTPPEPPQTPQRYVPAPPSGNWGADTYARQAAEHNFNVLYGSTMPSPVEYPGVIAGAGRQIARFSAPFVAGPAGIAAGIATAIGPLLDFYSHNAFSEHYRNQRLGGLAERRQALEEQRQHVEMEHERMIENVTRARVNQQIMLKDYDEVSQELEMQRVKNGGENTPEELEAAKQKIKDLNQKYQHTNIDTYLEKYGLPGVYSYLNWENAKFQDIWNAETSAKETKKKKEEETYDPYLGTGGGGAGGIGGGLTSGQTSGGDFAGVGNTPVEPAQGTPAAPGTPTQAPPADPLSGDPQALPDDYKATPPEQPTPEKAAPQKQSQAAKGVQVAGRGDIASDVPEPGVQQVAEAEQQPPQPKQSSYDKYARSGVLDGAQRSYPNINRELINQAALDMIAGSYKGPTISKNKAAFQIISARAQEMEAKLQQIIDDKDIKPGDVNGVIAAVDRLSPALAQHIRGFVDGTMSPPRSTNMAKGPWTLIYGLSKKADPSLDMNAFMYRGGTLRSFSSGQDGRNLTSIATAYGHLYSYIDDLKELKAFEARHGKDFLSKVQTWAAKRFGGYNVVGDVFGLTQEEQDLFARLENSMGTAGAEYERALTGGKPTVTGRADQERTMNWKNLNVDRVIGDARDKIDKLKQRMDQQYIRFRAGTGRDPTEIKPGEKLGTLDKMFGAYAAAGRGAGRDELGDIQAATPADAAMARWIHEHPNEDPPPEMYGRKARPARPGAGPPPGTKTHEMKDFKPKGSTSPGAPAGGSGYEELFR